MIISDKFSLDSIYFLFHQFSVCYVTVRDRGLGILKNSQINEQIYEVYCL